MSRASLSLAALLLACNSTRTPAAAPQPPPPPPPVDVPAAPPVVAPGDSGVATSADVVTDAPPERSAQERFVRALADGSTAIADAVDPALGLTVVHYVEAPPQGHTHEDITNRHHCASALTQALAALQRDLHAAVVQADQLQGMDCTAAECVVGGMEYAPSWHILFAATDGGAPRIEALTLVSEAGMNGAWTTRATAYVTRSLTTAHAHPCARR